RTLYRTSVRNRSAVAAVSAALRVIGDEPTPPVPARDPSPPAPMTAASARRRPRSQATRRLVMSSRLLAAPDLRQDRRRYLRSLRRGLQRRVRLLGMRFTSQLVGLPLGLIKPPPAVHLFCEAVHRRFRDDPPRQKQRRDDARQPCVEEQTDNVVLHHAPVTPVSGGISSGGISKRRPPGSPFTGAADSARPAGGTTNGTQEPLRQPLRLDPQA